MEGGVTPFSSGMAPSGSYILIVVSQPLNEEHKQIILQRLNQGLLSWDISSTGCDLSGLEYAFSANIKDSVTESDVLIQHSTESLGVEVLLSPTVRTLKQCVRNLLSTPTGHKQLVHAGYTFAGSGSWILENGTFSFEEFLEIFEQANVKGQKRCTVNVHCTEEGQWSRANFSRDVLTKSAEISLNPPEKVNHVPGSENLIKCLENALTTQSTEDMMKPSPLVGNIRFNRPTIYMFPAGQGDCALFGINGFNMLVDGGFNRKPCSWDFIRHLDRLDAVLVTRIGESNVCGMSTLMKRNAANNANPQIGYVFCNIAENNKSSGPSKDGSVEAKNDLIVSVVGEGHKFVQTLNDLKLKPHQCWRDSSIDPFVLYHKVGQGTLEMHVLSPPRDSKEMKQFLSEWNAYKENFSGVKSEMKGVEKMIPLSHATSICAILVWRPEDPKDTITRILFPGSAPQNKILEGLEKLKVLNILNHPVVTKSSLNIPTSKVISSKVEKSISRTSIPNRNNTASPVLSVSSVASRNGDIGGHKKEIKKVTKEVKKEVKEIKKDIKKDVKKDIVSKDIKKDIKVESSVKKDLTKKDSTKDVKKEVKDVKKVIKKENKEIKPANDKKSEIKSTLKKESTTPVAKSTTEVKKTSTVKKSTPPVKKDLGKPPIAPKENGTKKTVSKTSEPKAAKDVSNKKAVETKSVAKAKPKSTTASPKTPSTPKTKPVAVPKPGSKMTKAVAASSIVASAVAVTVAAFELNEKKETIEETEPETSEKEIEINGETKEIANEKSVEDVVSPLPPEVLSPTPSESVSLTPSDTLSSAPLETVSPTPPLPNEPISTEEKEVNEIKELEQDMPYEHDKVVLEEEVQNIATDDLKSENEVNDIEVELAKHQASDDVMSTSFVADKQYDDKEVEEHFEKTELVVNESVPSKVDIENECLSEKDVTEEKDVAEDKDVEEEKYETGEKYIDDEKDIADEKEIAEESDSENEDSSVNKNIPEINDKAPDEFEDEEENDASEDKESVKSNDIFEDKDCAVEKVKEGPVEEKITTEIEDLTAEKDIVEEKCIYEEKYATQDQALGEEKDVVEEKHILETGETSGEKDLFEEKYDIKDTSENKYHSEEYESKNTGFENKSGDNEYDTLYGQDTKEIEDQLAGMTMEGSFCGGMISTEKEGFVTESHFTHISENKDISQDEAIGDDSSQEMNVIEEQFEKTTISKTESHYGSGIIEEKKVQDEFSHESFGAHAMEPHIQSTPEEHDEDEIQHSTDYQSSSILSQHTNILGEEKSEQESLDENAKKPDSYENTDPEKYAESSELHFDRFSQMQSMEQSFHQDAYDNFENITNIDDLDMQETSVDEPEDIVRKESVVSITLNDDNLEEPYIDNYRRKSGTESEDDVDIGKYMCKEDQAVEEEKLHVQRGSDSDEEDVVKSPTPHAVVDYEGQLDDMAPSEEKSKGNDNEENRSVESKEAYMNEKDFDEKDRDSAEDQDSDDGEMIRHPTPPEIKYSEEEMRDPIGPHFITNPSLKVQGSDITDQPLYEEAEDSGSERSVSPIIEQPVFGNVVQADFPELVTVSGGTTPSEPQSPKGTFDNKKIPSESTVMEALSEHDISECSTHSPSCQDGSTAFDLQASDRSVIEAQSLKDEEIVSSEMLKNENKPDLSLSNLVASKPVIETKLEESGNIEQNMLDDKEDNQEDKKDSPSDEEESSSEDENSESHSKDKSDAMGDKSDVERDDRSDIHNDDRSDHHCDKSDVADDDKSDIHEDEHSYRQQSHQLDTEVEDVVQKDLKSDYKDEFGESYSSSYSARYENEYATSYDLKNSYETSSNAQNHPDFNYDSGIFKDENKHNSSLPATEEVQESLEAQRDTENEKIEAETANFPSFEKVSMDYLQNTQNTSGVGSNLGYESSIKSDNYEYESHFDRLGDVKESSHHDSAITQGACSDEAENIDEDEHGESSKTFRKDEADFESSKSSTVFYGCDSSNYKIENEEASVNPNSDALEEKLSEISEEKPHSFGYAGDSSLGQYDEELIKNQANLDENFYSSENTSTVQNKLLTDVDDVHKYDEQMHTYNEMYSGSTLDHDVSSDEQRLALEENSVMEEKGIEDFNAKIKSYSEESTFEYSSATTTNTFSGVNAYEIPDSFNNSNIMKESYTGHSYDEYRMGNTTSGFSNADSHKPMDEDYSHPQEHAELMQNEAAYVETRAENQITSEHIGEESTNVSKNNFTSDITEVNYTEREIESSVDAQEFTLVNGKEQVPSSLPSSDVTTEFIRTELTNNGSFMTTNQPLDPESAYLTSNRFHSDSPEDNTMRSDSSPDVPYPVSVTEKFPELKNSMSIETCSESYINSDDFKNNINFSGTDGNSLSQQNHSLNANQNNTYTESSDDEGNSLVRGNVSPYAYTNKAYSREEEDIDGNHIYKEETTEVIKQVEFDGNNLQNLSTNQVSSVMNYSQEYQDVQYSSGANYDFRLEEWGKPMGLPTPPDSSQKTLTKKSEKTVVKSKTPVDAANGKVHSPSVSSKMSSPLKKPKPKVAKESSSSPVYVDLAYVPQHADPNYCDVEFFKKIRARYYVISSVNPSKEVLNALLEAKKTWNEDLSVTIIPTYETDTLGYWMAQNQNDLAEYSIDVSPSASRCTVNLQDHQTSCSAYRLEF